MSLSHDFEWHEALNSDEEKLIDYYLMHRDRVDKVKEIIGDRLNPLLAMYSRLNLKKYTHALLKLGAKREFLSREFEVFPLLQDNAEMTSLMFLNNKYLVAGNSEGVVRFWDLEKGRFAKCFDAHEDEVSCFAKLRNNRYFFSAGRDGVIRMWDRRLGRCRREYYINDKGVTSMALFNDEMFFVLGGADGYISIWDVKNGKELKKTQVFDRGINSLLVLEDKDVIIVSSFWGEVKVLDLSLFVKHSFTSQRIFSNVSFSVDQSGEYVLLVLEDLGGVILSDQDVEFSYYDFNTECSKTLFGGFYKDSDFVLTVCEDKIIRWNLEEDDYKKDVKDFADFTISVACMDNNRDLLALGGKNGELAVCRLNNEYSEKIVSKFHFYSLNPGNAIKCALLDAKNDTFLILDKNYYLHFWDLNSGKLSKTLPYSLNVGEVCAFCEKEDCLVYGDILGTVEGYLIDGNKSLFTLFGPREPVKSIDVAKNEKVVAILTERGRLVVFDLKNNRVNIKTLKIQDNIAGFRVSDDGKFLIVVIEHLNNHFDIFFIEDMSVIIVNRYNIETLKLESQFVREWRNYGLVSSISRIYNERFWAYAKGSSILLYDFYENKMVKEWSEDGGRIDSLAFTKDGRYILSLDRFGTIRVRDMTNFLLVKKIKVKGKDIFTLKDGRHFVTVDYKKGTVYLWDIYSDNEIAKFICFSPKDWVTLTPEGYYNCSNSGLKYLGFAIGTEVFSPSYFDWKLFKGDLQLLNFQ